MTPFFVLINDFEAAALGMVELGPVDLTPVGPAGLPDLSQTEFVTAVVGPGTGFGAATLIKRDGRLTSLSGESGHVGFAPENPMQVELLASLANAFGRVSDERSQGGGNVCKSSSLCRNFPGEAIGSCSERLFSLLTCV